MLVLDDESNKAKFILAEPFSAHALLVEAY